MNTEIKNIILLGGAFLLLFACAELLYRKYKIRAEYTRKMVHVGTGLLTLLFPLLLSNHWSVLFLCGSFLIILLLSLKYKFLPGINAIDRISYGSIAYPIIVFICYLVWEQVEKPLSGDVISYLFFYLPILIMALADPAAALVGKAYPIGIFKWGGEQKSFAGSFAFFCVAFIISILFFINSSSLSLLTALFFAFILAILAAFTEVISKKGLDNLTIPLTVLMVLYVLIIIL